MRKHMNFPVMTMKKSVTSNVNYICIMDCLDPNKDLSTPRRNYDDLKIKLIGKDTPAAIDKNLELIKCLKKTDFTDQFKTLIWKFKTKGFKPLIIIHGHGSKDKGLHFPDGTSIAWEKLIKLYSNIIHKCNGDLMVISGFCHSMELIKHISWNNKLPFSFYYGYEGKIASGTVEDEMNIIYESLLKDGGKSLLPLLPSLKISLYGEFDFIMKFVALALAMATNPAELSRMHPNLSQNNIRKYIQNKHTGPQRGLGKLVNKSVRTTLLARGIIEEYMHNTERKQYAIEAVQKYFLVNSLGV